MDRAAWYGLYIGAGLWLIFYSRKTKNRAYLVIGIVGIVATLGTILLRSLP
jgi:hypothetical protein